MDLKISLSDDSEAWRPLQNAASVSDGNLSRDSSDTTARVSHEENSSALRLSNMSQSRSDLSVHCNPLSTEDPTVSTESKVSLDSSGKYVPRADMSFFACSVVGDFSADISNISSDTPPPEAIGDSLKRIAATLGKYFIDCLISIKNRLINYGKSWAEWAADYATQATYHAHQAGCVLLHRDKNAWIEKLDNEKHRFALALISGSDPVKLSELGPIKEDERIKESVKELTKLLTDSPLADKNSKQSSDVLLSRKILTSLLDEVTQTFLVKVVKGFLAEVDQCGKNGERPLNLAEWATVSLLLDAVLVEHQREYNNQKKHISNASKICEELKREYKHLHEAHFVAKYARAQESTRTVNEEEVEALKSKISQEVDELEEVKNKSKEIEEQNKHLDNIHATNTEVQWQLTIAGHLQSTAEFAWNKLSHQLSVDYLEEKEKPNWQPGYSSSISKTGSVGVNVGYDELPIDIPYQACVYVGGSAGGSSSTSYSADDELFVSRVDLNGFFGTFVAKLDLMVAKFTGTVGAAHNIDSLSDLTEWPSPRVKVLHQYHDKGRADMNIPEYAGHKFDSLIYKNRNNPEFAPFLSRKASLGRSTSYIDFYNRDEVANIDVAKQKYDIDVAKQKYDESEKKKQGDMHVRFSLALQAANLTELKKGIAALNDPRVTMQFAMSNYASIRTRLSNAGREKAVHSLDGLKKASTRAQFTHFAQEEIEELKKRRKDLQSADRSGKNRMARLIAIKGRQLRVDQLRIDLLFGLMGLKGREATYHRNNCIKQLGLYGDEKNFPIENFINTDFTPKDEDEAIKLVCKYEFQEAYVNKKFKIHALKPKPEFDTEIEQNFALRIKEHHKLFYEKRSKEIGDVSHLEKERSDNIKHITNRWNDYQLAIRMKQEEFELEELRIEKDFDLKVLDIKSRYEAKKPANIEDAERQLAQLHAEKQKLNQLDFAKLGDAGLESFEKQYTELEQNEQNLVRQKLKNEEAWDQLKSNELMLAQEEWRKDYAIKEGYITSQAKINALKDEQQLILAPLIAELSYLIDIDAPKDKRDALSADIARKEHDAFKTKDMERELKAAIDIKADNIDGSKNSDKKNNSEIEAERKLILAQHEIKKLRDQRDQEIDAIEEKVVKKELSRKRADSDRFQLIEDFEDQIRNTENKYLEKDIITKRRKFDAIAREEKSKIEKLLESCPAHVTDESLDSMGIDEEGSEDGGRDSEKVGLLSRNTRIENQIKERYEVALKVSHIAEGVWIKKLEVDRFEQLYPLKSRIAMSLRDEPIKEKLEPIESCLEEPRAQNAEFFNEDDHKANRIKISYDDRAIEIRQQFDYYRLKIKRNLQLEINKIRKKNNYEYSEIETSELSKELDNPKRKESISLDEDPAKNEDIETLYRNEIYNLEQQSQLNRQFIEAQRQQATREYESASGVRAAYEKEYSGWIPAAKPKVPVKLVNSGVERHAALLASFKTGNLTASAGASFGTSTFSLGVELSGKTEYVEVGVVKNATFIDRQIDCLKGTEEKDGIKAGLSIDLKSLPPVSMTDSIAALFKAEEQEKPLPVLDTIINGWREGLLTRIIDKETKEVIISDPVHDSHFTIKNCLKYLNEDAAIYSTLQCKKQDNSDAINPGVEEALIAIRKRYGAKNTGQMIRNMFRFYSHLLALSESGPDHQVWGQPNVGLRKEELSSSSTNVEESATEVTFEEKNDEQLNEYQGEAYISHEKTFSNKVLKLQKKIKDAAEKIYKPIYRVEEPEYWKECGIEEKVTFETKIKEAFLKGRADLDLGPVAGGVTLTGKVKYMERDHTNETRDIDQLEFSIAVGGSFGSNNPIALLSEGVNRYVTDGLADIFCDIFNKGSGFLVNLEKNPLALPLTESGELMLIGRAHKLTEYSELYANLDLPEPGVDGWVHTWTRVLQTKESKRGGELSVPLKEILGIPITPKVGLSETTSETRCLREEMTGNSFNNYIMHYNHSRGAGEIDRETGKINPSSKWDNWRVGIIKNQRRGLIELFNNVGQEQHKKKDSELTPLLNELKVRSAEYEKNHVLDASEFRKFQFATKHFLRVAKHYDALNNYVEKLDELKNSGLPDMEKMEQQQTIDNAFHDAKRYFIEQDKNPFDACMDSFHDLMHAYSPHFNAIKANSDRHQMPTMMVNGQRMFVHEIPKDRKEGGGTPEKKKKQREALLAEDGTKDKISRGVSIPIERSLKSKAKKIRHSDPEIRKETSSRRTANIQVINQSNLK